MTTKEVHVLNFWFAKLSELNCETGRAVSIGEVARYVGQSRGTAKKYLDRLVKEKAVVTNKAKHANKITYLEYHVNEAQS